MNTARFNITRQSAFCDASGALIETVALGRTAGEAMAYLDTLTSTPARPGRTIHRHTRCWNTLTRFYTDGYEEYSIFPSGAAYDRGARLMLMETALYHRWPGAEWHLVNIGGKVHVHWRGALAITEVAHYLDAHSSRDVVLHRRQAGDSDPDHLVSALAAKRAEIDELVRAYQADPRSEDDGARTADHHDRHADLTGEALEIAEQIIANAELGRFPTTWIQVPPA